MADESSIVANESGSTPAPAGGEAPGGAASTPASSDVSRESSTPHSGEGAESRESLLDVVRKAAPRKDAQPGPGDERGVSRSGESAAPGSAQAKEDLGPLTQAEVDAFSPRTRKRIDEFRAQINGLKSQIGPLEAQAQTTQALQNLPEAGGHRQGRFWARAGSGRGDATWRLQDVPGGRRALRQTGAGEPRHTAPSRPRNRRSRAGI